MKKSISRIIQAGLVFLMIICCSIPVGAEEPGTASSSNTISQAQSIARTIEKFEGHKAAADVNVWRSMGALIFILGALFAANHWLRKRSAGIVGRPGQRKRLRMIERFAIDQKRSLMLVAVDDRELLLGVGTDHITNLMELPTEQDELDELVEPHLEKEKESTVSRIISMVGQR